MVSLKLTKPQNDFRMLNCKYPAFVAGFGCVHPHTEIWTEHGLTRICDLKPLTRVLSWNEKSHKFQLSLSGGGYPKDRGSLYRVTTEQGEFVATSHHHSFSSDCKYLPVSSFSSGQELMTVSDDLLKTISESDLLSSFLDVQNYSEIDEGLMVRYAIEARLYGQQLLKEGETYQDFLPSPDDARRLSYSYDLFGFLRKDGYQEQIQEHSRHGQSSFLHSKSRLAHLLQTLSFFEEGHTLTSHLERTYDCLPLIEQSPLMSECHRNTEQCSSRVHSFDSPLSVTRVLSIQDLGEEVYWDMQVLGTNNYVTKDGCIHHNTGKSEIMCADAMLDSMEGGSSSVIALYEPTYDLVRLILAPRLEEKLSEWGVPYKYNKSENIIYTSSGQFGDFVLRTLDNPERIVGYESFRAKIDELDTLKPEKAKEAWIKIIARNRQNPDTYLPSTNKPMNTVSVFTTPEGFRFVYDRWKKEPNEHYGMIQASTLSNPYLPDDYVESLRASYPSQLIEAYINGEFVNLTEGTVYNQYSRVKHESSESIRKGETLHVGVDFNVQKMSGVVCVKRGKASHVVGEIMGAYDTQDLCDKIAIAYPDNPVWVYPDASGNARKTSAENTDHQILRNAGFRVVVDNSNPKVRSRINHVNGALMNAKGESVLFINTEKAPLTAEALEQQVYDKKGEPDKQHDQDHPNDALGYYVVKAHPIRQKTRLF